MGEKDVWCERDQIGCVPAKIGGIGRRPADIDPRIAADIPA
jgi:hypothetical protein